MNVCSVTGSCYERHVDAHRVAALRREYLRAGLDESALAADPMTQFAGWFARNCCGARLRTRGTGGSGDGTVSIQELAVAIGLGQAKRGVFETNNDNRGPAVDGYAQLAQMPVGLAWCAMFVFFCYCEAQRGADNPGPATVNVDGKKLRVSYTELQSSDGCELYSAVVDVAGPRLVEAQSRRRAAAIAKGERRRAVEAGDELLRCRRG